MKEPETIVIGGAKPFIDCLYELQSHYNFDISIVAKSGEITLKLRKQ